MSSITWAVVLLAGFACTSADLGSPATIDQLPYLVQVEHRIGALWLQQCVGTVLTNFHVLGAASCYNNGSPQNRRIRAGTSTRGVGGTVTEITTIHKHPTYGLLGYDGDISVVRLELALAFGSDIQQASIAGQGVQLPQGVTVTVGGWGTTAEGGYVGNNDLYSIELVTTSEDECLSKYYEHSTPQPITENMFCAGLSGSNGRDLDSRDAGAPVIYDSVVLGLVSFGVSRGNDEYPIVSTSVGFYTSWIVEAASS